MSITATYIPTSTGNILTHEIKMVKILTGKYAGQIKVFCHSLPDGKVVVRIGAGHRLVYNNSSVIFVESKYAHVPDYR